MVLLNASKRARYVATTVVQNQGGGSKKAGLPYQIGRDSWANIYLGNNTNSIRQGRAGCTLGKWQMTYTNAHASRPIGRTGNSTYWKFP